MTASRLDDLILCGGGVIGLAIAWQASKRGWQVRILDQRGVGKGASWAGAGILPPGAKREVHDPLEELRGRSHAMFDAWCKELEQASGVDTGFRRCGGIYLARTNGEFATLSANQAWWEDHGIDFESWSPSETARRVSALMLAVQSGLKGAWYLPEECQIRNPHYLRALEIACRKNGVIIHEDEPIIHLEEKASSVAVQSNANRYLAKQVCITAGAWTPLAIPELQPQTGIYPVRGQMVLFRSNTKPFDSILNEGHRYLVPRDDGYVLAGSCEEEAGYDERTTPEMIDQLTHWARELTPCLESATIEKTWSGLRPGTIDGLPYLGKVPERENIYLAAGHYRHGIHLSPITAELMAALMAAEQPSIDLTPFSVTRGKTFCKR